MQTIIHANMKAFFAAMLLLITGTLFGQTWNNTNAMSTGRTTHTATLLSDGRVLVTGGYDGTNFIKTCEVYDPNTGTWSATGSMVSSRGYHTATLLPNGKVLVAGGRDNSTYFNTCELYDPNSGTWSPAASMGTNRGFHTATTLPDGKVLVAGGFNGSFLNTCEIYDPVAASWSGTGFMASTRDAHTATLLPNGKVLVAGGYNGAPISSCEVYNPASGTWGITNAMSSGREFFTSTLLPDGKVLVAGGMSSSTDYLNSCELYDPLSGSWSGTGSMAAARQAHTAVLLANNRVLAMGGFDGSNFLKSCELYDPFSGTWNDAVPMAAGRGTYTATVLVNGNILAAGSQNFSGSSSVSSCEVFTYSSAPPQYVISASSGGNGSISPAGELTVTAGSDQEFTIAPFEHYSITDVQVDGASVGAVSDYTFYSISADHTISANFALQTFPVTATAGAHGTITPSGTSNVAYGNDITYTVTPDDGYQIVAESIDDPSSFDYSQTSSSYTFTNVQSAHTIAALFAKSAYSLSYTSQANGSVNGAVIQTVNYHSDGTPVTAVPDPGYHFVSWSDGSMANPRTDTYISDDVAVSASFARTLYNLTTSIEGHGKITGKITFTADPGYHISDVQVDGSSVGTVNNYTFSDIASDHTVNAIFAVNTYTITATSTAHGTISPAGTGTVNYGDNLTYTIVPEVGYHISQVTIDGSPAGTISNYTFTNVIHNHNIRATFAINSYMIVSGADVNGTITPSGSVSVNYGTTKKFTIKPNSGYYIMDVLVDGVSVGAVKSYSFASINGDHTISASFAANTGFNSVAATSKQLQENTWSLSATPNPVKNNVRVAFTVTKKGNYFIKLTSVSGEVISVQKVNALAGTNTMELNTSGYANGNYFITLMAGSKAKTISIIKAQ